MESAYYILENHLPSYTWPLLMLIFLISMGICMWRGKESHARWPYAILVSLLITYIVAILFTTLIFRTTAVSADATLLHKAKWMPFWSWYEVIVNHSKELMAEILLNVLLFLPVGVLMRLLGVSLRSVLLFCVIFSGGIELAQYVTCRGLCEWDDVIGNTFGGVLGWCAGGFFGKAVERALLLIFKGSLRADWG